MLMIEHNELLSKANESIEEIKPSVEIDYWRLQYHVTPTAYWMNDPNGFTYYKGEYHLFYQHHPYSPYWGPMHWGHVKSKDLVHWERLPIALAPSEIYDKDGCFSGSAIEKDGNLYLMYTGHRVTGNDPENDFQQVQALAASEDGINFKKFKDNPVIKKPPMENSHHAHFRDPNVWKHNDKYFCVIGSKTIENEGQVLLYESEDLLEWNFKSVIAQAEGNMGYMWECPNLFQLDGKDVLIISPQGIHAEGIQFQNLHQSGYFVGELNYETGEYTHGPFQLLDEGFDFYAPQSLRDKHDRRILVGWMDMWENTMPTQAHNWAGAMTVPRELRLYNNLIYSTPIPELKKLRGNSTHYQNVKVDKYIKLNEITGDCLELIVCIDPLDSVNFGINFRCSEDFSQKTVLAYDTKLQQISLDCTYSGKGEKGTRQTHLPLINKELKLHIFIDRSSIEVFLNSGEKIMTARIFPDEQSKGIEFFTDNTININSLQKWTLQSSWSKQEGQYNISKVNSKPRL